MGYFGTLPRFKGGRPAPDGHAEQTVSGARFFQERWYFSRVMIRAEILFKHTGQRLSVLSKSLFYPVYHDAVGSIPLDARISIVFAYVSDTMAPQASMEVAAPSPPTMASHAMPSYFSPTRWEKPVGKLALHQRQPFRCGFVIDAFGDV